MKRFTLFIIAAVIVSTVLFGPGDIINRFALGALGLVVLGGGFLLLNKLLGNRE